MCFFLLFRHISATHLSSRKKKESTQDEQHFLHHRTTSTAWHISLLAPMRTYTFLTAAPPSGTCFQTLGLLDLCARCGERIYFNGFFARRHWCYYYVYTHTRKATTCLYASAAHMYGSKFIYAARTKCQKAFIQALFTNVPTYILISLWWSYHQSLSGRIPNIVRNS